MAEWKLSIAQLNSLIHELIDLGVTSFDHADIYGDYSCESIFGQVLKRQPSLRNQVQIITKCGIKLTSQKFPNRKINYYDYSAEHILESVNTSLKNLHTDYIDLLLLHRPAPFFEPYEVSRAFDTLFKAGKVRYFGVSNFTRGDIELLAEATSHRLIVNQIEASPLCLDNFDNGTINYMMKENIIPMAWSPLGGGRLFDLSDEQASRLSIILNDIKNEMNLSSVEEVVYAWLLAHPSNILPVVGSKRVDRIRLALNALKQPLSLENWYRIYTASKGHDVP